MAELLKEEIEVYCEKYDLHGVVRDYGVLTKLFFTYGEKEIVMGITRNILKGETFKEVGENIIESYITNLSAHEDDRRLEYHYWYVDELEHNGEKYMIGHGIVTGHKRLADSNFSHSSAIQAMHVEGDDLVLTTLNSVYYCPLAYCDFTKQDKFPDLIPDYEGHKKKFKDKIEYPSIEPGKVLLVLADFCEYYFHSLYYIPSDSKSGKPLEYVSGAHIGTFQDSYLINTKKNEVGLSYFPHYKNVELYAENTRGCPFFIENIGSSVLYARTSCGTIRLDHGDRKEVIKENTEETPVLPGGDLYPAGIINLSATDQ